MIGSPHPDQTAKTGEKIAASVPATTVRGINRSMKSVDKPFVRNGDT